MVASSSFRSLPRDLLTEEILLRLPTKLLVQCKSVCKQWYDIISSPSFIDKHFNHHTNHTRLLLYYSKSNPKLGGYPISSRSLFPDLETLERHQVPDHLVLQGEITFFRGPCNGIFCIHIRENRFALWNPTTRRFRPIICSPSYKFDEVGFGVDPLTGDFKIVLIRALVYVSPCFAIYTSSNDSWRYLEQESLGDSYSRILTTTSGRYSFLNGIYYWILKQNGASVSILAFDMHNEIFEQMEAPEIIGGEMGGWLEIFNNSLVMFSSKRNDTEIWLLEGNGYWTQILNVVLPFENPYPHGFWGGNKILMQVPGINGYDLVMYDIESHNAKLLDIERGSDEFAYGYLAIHYKECLASVKGEHGSEDLDTHSVEGLKFLGYEGPYTNICCRFHREGAQIGTEEEESLNENPTPDGSIYNYEDYTDEPGMEDDKEDPYANYHPYPNSEGNLPLYGREEKMRNYPHSW